MEIFVLILLVSIIGLGLIWKYKPSWIDLIKVKFKK